MANFVAVVDPDQSRRERFLSLASPRLPLLPGLATGRCAAGDFAVAWAAGPRAPISHDADQRGAGVLFGDALLGDRGTRLHAGTLRTLWSDRTLPVPPTLDGYHAGVTYSREQGLVAGVDLLGWFPLYWFASGDVVLVASSPEPILLHPLCRTTFDPAALVGILLMNGLAGAPSMLSPIRRLSSGHLLTWSPERGAREVRQYALPAAGAGEDLPWYAYLERLDAALADTVRRHVGDTRRCWLLLSGGLDSRTVAGYLHRQGTEVDSLTEGRRSDVEMRCAAGVARALGFSHHPFEVPSETLPDSAELSARWEHLAGGFSSVGLLSFRAVPRLAEGPDRVAAGFGFDHLLHANSMTPMGALAAGELPFATAFEVRNRYGIPPAVLQRLLLPEGGRGVIRDVLAELAGTYNALASVDTRRYWAFAISDRVRNHVGISNWRICFGAWPILPMLDRRLIDSVAAMPVAALTGRRLQNELMIVRFPALAGLPLDRASLDDTPLRPNLGYLLRSSVARRLAPVRRRLPGGSEDRRFFKRTFRIDSPEWRAVRRRAEPHRDRLRCITDRAVLDQVLPPPDVTVTPGPGLPGNEGRKLLLGLILWADGRF
jgi:asparagine synthase (glutamine-hydrolysing)